MWKMDLGGFHKVRSDGQQELRMVRSVCDVLMLPLDNTCPHAFTVQIVQGHSHEAFLMGTGQQSLGFEASWTFGGW